MNLKALKLSNFANKVISVVCCDSPFLLIAQSVTNLSATFEKEHGMSFSAARRVHFDEDMVSPDFLSGNSLHTSDCYIKMTNFLLERPIILSIIG